MARFCGVVNCSNRAGRDPKSLFRLPAKLNRATLEKQTLSRERRQQWLNALKRKDLTEKKKKYLWICEDHFINKKPANLADKYNPDWILNQNMGYDFSTPLSAFDRYQRSIRRTKLFEEPNLDEGNLMDTNTENGLLADVSLDINTENVLHADVSLDNSLRAEDKFCDKGTQTDLTMTDIDQLIQSNRDYTSSIVEAKNKIKKLEINRDTFEHDDEKTKYYTGIPSFETLLILFSLVESSLPPISCLTHFQHFIMTLMHLRLNLDFHDLAYRFNVSKCTVSNLFYSCLNVLYVYLQPIIVWPEREVLRSNMPALFVDAFKDKVTVIIDCFEIQIERPSNLRASAQSWSNYKQRNTIKLLIGISPQGSICYISKAWGGRTSDKYLTENCGFLNNIIPGDLLIADRGFNIKDSVGLYCAEVVLPAFTKNKKQLNAVDVEKTRSIANVRIHVERVIGSLRQKYRILETVMPIRMIAKQYTDGSTAVDRIVTVCCGLVNFCPSVIPTD